METLIAKLLSGPVIAINLGLKLFGASLEQQGVDVVQVDWTPPAGGIRRWWICWMICCRRLGINHGVKETVEGQDRI